MRLLVACPACARQLDAGDLKPGSRFRCACGEAIEVPVPRPHDADVVRCSACGATRDGGADACTFCGSDFTLHERDLHTLCPGCMARISDRARYCHHCATRIAPQGLAGELTIHPCPVCGDDARLTSRRLDGTDVAVEECGRCAGLWIDHETVRTLVDRAGTGTGPVPGMPTPKVTAADPDDVRRPAQAGMFYRACPACERLMQRRNWGLKSGVLVDVCSAHGTWFDSDELARILGWVRDGGLEIARRQAEAESRDPGPVLTSSAGRGTGGPDAWSPSGGGFLLDVLELLARLGTGIVSR
jgi:Zn-finger nucleic acid-binding protein